MNEIINRATIKKWVKERKCKTDDLLVMAQKNDPFYCGSPTDIAQAEWFGKVYQKSGFEKAHLRKIHYAHLSDPSSTRHNGKPYANIDPDWKYMGTASLAARYLGLVPFATIIDKKQPDPHLHAVHEKCKPSFWVNAPDLADPYIQIDGFIKGSNQPYYKAVLVEKSTMDDWLDPLCKAYNADLITSEGEFTGSCLDSLGRRIQEIGKPARIFIIADFDPAGFSIRRSVARRLEYFMRENQIELDVRVCSLALNLSQVEALDLPRVEIKETETRKESFQKRFGSGGAELDALETLHPGSLERMVRNALSAYYSPEATRDLVIKEKELRQAIRAKTTAITERYADTIEALAEMMEELENVEIEDIEQFKPEPVEPSPESDDHFTWLLDSRRDYFEQLAAYRRFEEGAA